MSLSKAVYDRSPVWLENFMVSVQGWIYNRRRCDMRLAARLLDELRTSQWWTEEQFRDYQDRKVQAHITMAATEVPYYKKLFKKEGIDPTAIRTADDLQQIPFLEKDTIRSNPAEFLRGGRPDSSWNRLFTSGTTGSPLDLYSSRESFSRIWSFVFRLREWAGLEDPLLPRRVQFTGRDIVPDTTISDNGVYWRRNLPGNALLMSTSHLSAESAPRYASAIRRFRPRLIDGYPSAIATIARASKSLGLELPSPRGIITSAETLFARDRNDIADAFKSTVFDQYASSDTGAFICDCEHGNLHVNPEFGVCEILDPSGKPAPPGTEGEIVTTSFCNTEQVFIRYRIGDCAVQGTEERCECGRRMPRVERITGRVDDILFIRDRGFVGRLDPIFKSLHGIQEAQVVQESLDRLSIGLVPEPTYDRECEKGLVAALRRKVGHTVAIDVTVVNAIPRGANGKFRSVISLCKDDYPTL